MDLKGKNVFLSGGMTGYTHNNVAAFVTAHAILRELGAAHVYDPALAWLTQPREADERMTHEDYMVRCIRELTRKTYMGSGTFYDLLVQLPCWEFSDGAWLEMCTAEGCGIEVVELEALLLGEGDDGGHEL